MKTPKGFKRALAGVLAVLTLAGYVPANTPWLLKKGIGIVAHAADIWESGGCVVTLDAEGTLTVSKKDGGDGKMADYDNSNNKPAWYDQRSDITKVVVEEGVTSIGSYAFSDCTSMASADLPEGLETIGANAFESCGDLQTVDLPEGLESIGDYAFNECDINSLVLRDGLKYIGEYAFAQNNLQSLELPAGLETIGNHAFENCRYLFSVTFSEGLQTIGESAFQDCTSLQSLTFSQGLQTVGDHAFEGCNELKSTAFSEGLKTLGQDAFKNCSELESVTFSGGPERIENNAFDSCNEMKSVTFSEGLQEIGSNAFYSCSSLTSVELPKGLQIIGGYAFEDCGSLEHVTLPEGLQEIGEYAFSSCYSLKSVTFPDGLEKTGYATFAYCNSLESADLPEGLKTIDDDAFYCCNELKRVVIPSTVTSLEGAFGCCFKLNDVYCYADADTLTWNEDKDDYIGNKGTVFHVKASQLEAFQQMYPDSRNTFAGDLPDEISLSDAAVTIKPDTAEVESVKVGDYTLIPGTDYTVKYLHGGTELEAVPEIIGAYTAVICGQGAWKDTSKEVPFTIEKKENVQYSFDFADQEQLNDLTFIDLDGDGKNWYQTSRDDCIGMNGETGVLVSASYQVKPLTPDNWAIMPAGTVWNIDKPEMTFWAKAQDYNYPNEYFAVYAIPEKEADFEHFDAGKWTMVMEKTKSNTDFTEYKVDLSAFKGQRIYVAIRHYDVTDQFLLKVDDVTLPMGDYKDQTSIDGASVTTPGYSADVTVSLNGSTLAPGDYYLLYKQDNTLLDEPPTEPGSYFAVIVGISGYKGVIEHPFTIRDDFAEAELSLDYNTANIDAFTVGGKKLTAGKDYTVTYMNGDTVMYNAPTAVGEYTIVITGKGDYVGIFRKEFKILSAIDAFNGDPSQNPTVTLTEDDDMVYVLRNDGTLDLNGHTFDCLWLLNEDPQKTVTVKNGTIGWENSWVNMNNCPPALGMIVLENITIPSFSAAARSVTVKSGSYGTFENLAYQNLPAGYTPVIRIEGGEFGKLNLTEGAGTYEICGGIFDEKPNEAYLADGYAFYETADQKWECVSIEPHGHDFTEAWDWASDMSTATLTLTCECGEKVENLEAEITTEENADGTTTFIATAEYDGKTYTDSKSNSISVNFGHNIALDNSFTIFYYVDRSEVEGFSDLKLTINKDGADEQTITDYTLDTVSGRDCYTFKYKGIAAKEMGVDVKAVLSAEKDGVTFYSNEDVYSIQQYAMKKLDTTSDQNLKPLLVDMLNYGAAAQTYFDFRTGELVNKNLSTDMQNLATDFASLTVEDDSVKDSTSVILGHNLELGNNLKVVYYLDLESISDKENVTLELSYTGVTGKEYKKTVTFSEMKAVKKNVNGVTKNLYEYDYDEIAAKDSLQPISATVFNNGTQISDTDIYSVPAYARRKLDADSTTEELRAVIESTIVFYNSAKNYFTA